MAIKLRLLRHILLTALFLYGATSILYSQNAGYSFNMENGEARFTQRLAWVGGEYALRYEVLIERLEGGSYVNYRQESTTALFIDISLPPGEYRFRVIPYDILDRPGEGTQWAQIEVLRALKPEILDTPGRYIENENAKIHAFEVDGKDIAPDAEIYFRGQDGELVPPLDVTVADNGSVMLQFDREKLKTGEYELIVKNPGGLETSVNVVVFEVEKKGRLKPLKSVIFNIGIFLSPPVISLYGNGDVYDTQSQTVSVSPYGYGNIYDGQGGIYGGQSQSYVSGGESLFVSAAMNLNVGFRIPSGIHIGPEVTMLYQIYETEESLFNLGLNLLVKKWLPGDRFALCFRLGAEFMPEDSSIFDNLRSNLGISFFWRIFSIFYAEGGIDYINLFDNPSYGFARIRIGFGVQP